MGKGFEQTFLQRRHTNGHCLHETMLNVISYQENAKQNTDTTSYPLEWLKSKQQTVRSADNDMEKLEASHTAGDIVKLIQPLWKTV